jgi:hypothetical protein
MIAGDHPYASIISPKKRAACGSFLWSERRGPRIQSGQTLSFRAVELNRAILVTCRNFGILLVRVE